jgi:putative N6-adenine-specific DNA methylase
MTLSAGCIKRPKGAKRKLLPYQYQNDGRYFAMVADDLKEAAMEELSELGAEDIKPEYSGIYFTADKQVLYSINYLTRLISRCLAPLVSFDCPDTDTLYRRARQLEWRDFLKKKRTFAVSANVSDSAISHSQYAALRLKDAIADHFMERYGKRPDVSAIEPDVSINLHIRHDKAVISFDTSGGALHRRGYREETVSAPMQETVAASIIRFSGWDGSVPLYDPMCGSGTLLCEALMKYSNIPAGIFRRRFGFESLPDFDSIIWRYVKKESDGNIRELPKGLIAGSDISENAVDAARVNLMGLHYGNNVDVKMADFRELPGLEDCLIVTNPPYGIRMGSGENLEEFYTDLGDFLKQKCKGSNAFVYFGDRKYIKNVGLKTSYKKLLKAGGLDGRLVKYELY